MNFKKKIFKNSFFQNIFSFLAYIYILVVIYSSKIIIINSKNVEDLWKNKSPFILAFWHSQLLMISYVWKSEEMLNILASMFRFFAAKERLPYFCSSTVRQKYAAF